VTLNHEEDEHIMHGSWGLTVLRLAVGAVFVMHGAQKLFETGLSALAASFGAMHIPAPVLSSAVVTFIECFGGLALMLGVFTTWAATLLAIDMLIAVVVVHLEPGFFKKAGIELPITLLAASVALALSGPGAASLDAALRHRT
jgi:putative oxidoreductase